MNNKKVLICGGTNFMGPHLVRKLINEGGYDVSLVHRGNHLIDLPVKNIFLDINNNIENFNALDKFYDCIIGCSVYSPQAVKNILDNVKTKQYIMISSMAVYPYYHDNISENEYDSENLVIPFVKMEENYTTRKRQAETCLKKDYSAIKTAIIRPGYVIDDVNPEHKYNQRIREIVNCVMEGAVINSKYIDFKLPLTRATEEAEFIFKLCDSETTGVFNLSSEGEISVRNLIQYVEKQIGKKSVMSDIEGELLNFRGDGKSGATYNLSLAKSIHKLSRTEDWIYGLVDYYIENYKQCINWQSINITGEF